MRSWRWTLLAALVLAFTLAGGARPAAAAGTNTITTLDSAGDVGLFTSLAIGTDGKPVISYWDDTNNDLKVAHCGNASCSSGNTLTAVDGADDVGRYTSLAIGADGKPVISYFDDTNSDLKVAHCGDQSCSSANTITTVDSAGYVGFSTSIAIGTDGKPIISYAAGYPDSDLKVAHCGDASCSSGNTLTIVDAVGTAGGGPIAIGADGNPVISYVNGVYPDFDLKVAHCGDVSCSSGNTLTIVDGVSDVGYASIAIGADGVPVISYFDDFDNHLKVAHCGNVSCSSGNTVAKIDSAFFYNAIAVGADGNPVVSYEDVSQANLKVAHCVDASCSFVDRLTTVDSATIGLVGRDPSIAIGTDGKPVMSYWVSTDDLKVAHCGDARCAGSNPQINITNVGQYALPKTCFQVRNSSQIALFTICDNDFAGAPAVNAICSGGACNDEDPAQGSTKVTVNGGDYRVVETTVAPQHTIVTGKQACDASISACSVTFLNTPRIHPWYPWDITGGSCSPTPCDTPDGRVRVNDVSSVIQHYRLDKPLP